MFCFRLWASSVLPAPAGVSSCVVFVSAIIAVAPARATVSFSFPKRLVLHPVPASRNENNGAPHQQHCPTAKSDVKLPLTSLCFPEARREGARAGQRNKHRPRQPRPCGRLVHRHPNGGWKGDQRAHRPLPRSLASCCTRCFPSVGSKRATNEHVALRGGGDGSLP